jgi:hypothetical protein
MVSLYHLFHFRSYNFNRQLFSRILNSRGGSSRIIHNSCHPHRQIEERMARKPRQTRAPKRAEAFKAVTAERAARLYRLLKLLGAGPQGRGNLVQRLHLDIRGFYRDLELLRAAHIDVLLTNQHYSLTGRVKEAIARLPFPDPHLTLGEATELAKGRSPAHRKLKAQVKRIVKGK